MPAAAPTPQVEGPAVADPAPDVLKNFAAPAVDEKRPVRDEDSAALDGDIQTGRNLFDDAGVQHGDPALPDLIPAWPGETGDTVRIAGATYTLGAKVGEGAGARVYRAVGRPELVVKLVHPAHKDAAAFGYEADDIAALGKTAVSQSRLHARSADGLALVKEFIPGPTAKELLDRGPLSELQTEALGRFAAELLRGGYSADLKPANLVWREDKRRWTLIDSGGARKDSIEDALGYFFIEDWREKPLAGAAFLSALRSQLGADSAQWKRLAKEGPDDPLLERAFEELARAEKDRPTPERGDFLPPHPAPGESVLIGGVLYVLGAQIGAGQGINGAVFRVEGPGGLIIKFPISGSKANAQEAKNLKLLDTKKIAHTRLVAASADGTVLVKTFAAGETGKTIVDRGPLSPAQFAALVEFAADLVRAEISPDVKPANLVWDAPGGRWILIDGGNLGAAKGEEVIEWMLHPSQLPATPPSIAPL